jgi:hypothetical protein
MNSSNKFKAESSLLILRVYKWTRHKKWSLKLTFLIFRIITMIWRQIVLIYQKKSRKKTRAKMIKRPKSKALILAISTPKTRIKLIMPHLSRTKWALSHWNLRSSLKGLVVKNYQKNKSLLLRRKSSTSIPKWNCNYNLK